jgi:hypothetical protein
MAKWVKAIVREDPDPVGKRNPRRRVTHAFNLDEDEAAHPITDQYAVRRDEPWSNPVVGGDRCGKCEEIAGR